MRGVGSVTEGIVQPDWRLQGIDMVLGPSFDTHVSQASIFESEELSPSIITENIEGRFSMALKSGFKGTMQEYQAGINAKGDDEKIRALFQGAVRAGYKGNYLSYRAMYLNGRKA
jgi:hypothetical protein